MTLDSNLIAPLNSGLETDQKPFLLLDSAFQELTNAMCWRNRIKKREGIKLVGRLRRTFTSIGLTQQTSAGATTTIADLLNDASINLKATEPYAELEPGSIVISIVAPDIATYTDQGDGTFVVTGIGVQAGSYINYTSGEIVLKTNAATGGATITVNFNYFPSMPCMGIHNRELGAINVEQTIFFDRFYAYSSDGNNFSEVGASPTNRWSGSDSSFFWATNYRGSTANARLFFVTNFSKSTGDYIYYYDGATWSSFKPAIANLGDPVTRQLMFQCKSMVSYYGRLLAFNTWEGLESGGIGNAVNYFNRVRFSQVGDPTQSDAWLSDVFGKGGYTDAPTNEAFVTTRFYKNTLIVFFERSTWNLNYVGEYGLPFSWERISSDYGSESTYSSILFDSGILAVGDKAIVISDANNVKRIDEKNPDLVFNFHNQDNGKERVQGTRDFQKEIVYWCYSDSGLRKKFPNRSLLYNYKNLTWSIFRDNVTAFGQFSAPNGISWDSPTSWDSNISWDTIYQSEFPVIVSGNQQGFIHFYQYPGDYEDTADSNVDAIENESLSIYAISRGAGSKIRITSYNHNLEDDEVVYLSGLKFIDTSDSTTLTSSLNDSIFSVQIVDDDTFDLYFYDYVTQSYKPASDTYLSYTPAVGTGTYIGGGYITLFPKMSIRTKDFNPYQKEAKEMNLSRIDFQTDATPNARVSVNVSVNSNNGPYGNITVGNTNFATSSRTQGIIQGITNANPCQITSPSHGLRTDDQITINNVKGTTELNKNSYTVTFIDLNTFSLQGVDATLYGAYQNGGNWTNDNVQKNYIPDQQYCWHRFFTSARGEYISLQLTYDDQSMNIIDTHREKMELNAINVWSRKAGRIM